MKKTIALLSTILAVITNSAVAQTTLKEHKAGHIFYVSLPDYMSKTVELNSAAAIQYKSAVKDVYGFIIEDNKEELAMAGIKLHFYFGILRRLYQGFCY